MSRRPGSSGPARTAFLPLLGLVTLTACGRTGERQPATPPPEPDPAETADTVPSPDDPPDRPAPAPWSASPLSSDVVPAPYLEAWNAADNRGWCALLAFEDPTGELTEEPTPRTARFGGGWGVAYDLPGLRSAFGVAGTGVRPGPDTYDDWPYRREWRDGSRAGWGPEGGSGPRQLAYLRVAGQECLYNVWSQLGSRHLERLLDELRRVGHAP